MSLPLALTIHNEKNCPSNLQQISSEHHTRTSTPPPPPQAVVSKIAQAKRTEQTQDRGPAFVFIEMLCALLTVSALNNKLCDGRNKRDRFEHLNDTYQYYVQVMWDSKQWVDQLGVAEDKTTPAKSIQDRCCVIKTDTDRTTISTVVEKIMSLTRNVFLSKLWKLLDSNGHIRSGQQKEDVREAIRLFYFAYVKMPRAKKSLNCDESEGDDHVEHVEKAMEQPKDSLHDPVKFQTAQDRFHPPEMYVFFHQGPEVIDG